MSKSHIDSELYEILHFTPETSSEVQDKIDNAYEQIRSGKIQVNKKKRIHKLLYPGVAAAIIILLGLLGFSNPALAGKIPFIGRIFRTIENSIGYSGNYSDYAAKITAPENSTENNDDSQTNINTNKNSEDETKSDSDTNVYSQTSGDITITLSEVVCTDMSLYISLEIYNEEEFPEVLNRLKNLDTYTLTYNFLFMACNDYFDFEKDSDTNYGPYMIEGDYIDSHTFLGIIRTDLDLVRRTAGLDVLPDEFIYSINISQIWGLLDELEEGEIIDPITGETKTIVSTHKRYNGEWDYTIPITIDRSGTQVKEIMETNEDGLGISKVTRTRYEIQAEIIPPEGKAAYDYIVIITDADGNTLESQGMIAEVYSLYGRNTDTVHIYVMDGMDGFEYMGDKAYLLPEKALFQTTVTW
ncbi:MAG: DUF4179 domain-containing protein [Lachnospiraceae bacterium]|nr:DUF4179 domain-containing protein [Lachnospiraceae bacterium]